MVTISDYKLRESLGGKPFYALILQGGMELVQSSTGGSYLTARNVSLPTTFDEVTCQSMIGGQLPGSIQKVETEPYEYTIQETGEVITLSHRYEYVEEIAKEQVIDLNSRERKPFSDLKAA